MVHRPPEEKGGISLDYGSQLHIYDSELAYSLRNAD